MKKILFRITLFFFSFFVRGFFVYSLFLPLYQANSVIFPYSITPFDIAKSYPKIWDFIKQTYFIFMFISYFIIYHYLYHTFQKILEFKNNNLKAHSVEHFDANQLRLLIGNSSNGEKVFLKESGLYQNMLITGTIGSRKDFLCDVSFYQTVN